MFIVKWDLKFADVPVLDAGQTKATNLIFYPIRVKRFESFYQEYFTNRSGFPSEKAAKKAALSYLFMDFWF